ncbi:MAG: mechanosensitive ion channel family protein [Pseudobdellovibrionaceae bacterium]
MWSWFITVVLSLAFALAIKSVTKLVSFRLRKFAEQTSTIWDDVAVDLLDGLKSWVICTWILYVLSLRLSPPEAARKSLFAIAVFSIIFQIGIWGIHLIRTWRRATLDRIVRDDPSAAAALGLLSATLQVAYVVTIILIGLSNLGVNIGALLAGLGVGGIAVALAAQNILGDLLASLSIVLDKPFVIGDFIVAGNHKGTVTNVGIKTTRLQSLSGEELILSNKDLLESRIQNFKRMQKRRVVQTLGVVYSTPAETLEKIPVWVREVILKREKLEFDRCHFCNYGASSLDFEFVFYVNDPEYNVYMDLQEEVLMDLFKKFRQEGVEFAFPSRSVFIEKMP